VPERGLITDFLSKVKRYVQISSYTIIAC
jgi:hypothetical protein